MTPNEKHKEFEREALPHMDLLYNYALRITGASEDASDLLQETYLKAYRFWDKYEKGTNIRAWLFRIMKNSYINLYRRESKEPEKVDFDEVKEYYPSVQDSSADRGEVEQPMFSQLLEDDLATALAELPEEFRTVVILCDIEGLPYEEAAQFIERPVGTVRSRLHRGRKLLRERLQSLARQRGYVSKD